MCTTTSDCDAQCQRSHWPKHKVACGTGVTSIANTPSVTPSVALSTPPAKKVGVKELVPLEKGVDIEGLNAADVQAIMTLASVSTAKVILGFFCVLVVCVLLSVC